MKSIRPILMMEATQPDITLRPLTHSHITAQVMDSSRRTPIPQVVADNAAESGHLIHR